MKKLFISMAILTLLGSVSFAVFSQNTKSSATTQLLTSNVNAANKQSLGDFLKDHNTIGDIAQAYRIAYENPQNVLSQVKCYCGCIKNNGHKNNRDCFINEDGSFDLMGLNCGLCVKTAIVSNQMLADGKTVQEISDYVDARWGKEGL